jgi:WD40 repeat protein
MLDKMQTKFLKKKSKRLHFIFYSVKKPKIIPEIKSRINILNPLLLVEIAHSSRMCHLWSLDTYKRIKSIELNIDDDYFQILDYKVIQQNQQIAVLFDNGLLRIFNLNNGECIKKLGKITSVNLDDTQSQIRLILNIYIVLAIESKISFYNIDNYALEKTFNFAESHPFQLLAIFNSNNNMLVSSCHNDLSLIGFNGANVIRNFSCLEEINSAFKCVQIFPNEIMFASVFLNKINIWNVNTGVCLKTIRLSGLVYDLSLTSNGNLISCTNNGFIQVWNGLKLMKKFKSNSKPFCVRALSSNKLISISFNEHVRVWNIFSGKLLKRFHLNNYITKIEYYSQ